MAISRSVEQKQLFQREWNSISVFRVAIGSSGLANQRKKKIFFFAGLSGER
jgi:hypothetical protein